MICCVEKQKIDKGLRTGVFATALEVDNPFFKIPMLWKERAEIENNTDYLQIIPYIVLKDINGRFCCYKRHGKEKRLFGLQSCGIGGHIEECDKMDTIFETAKKGLMREISEELEMFCFEDSDLIYNGLVFEDLTAVGLSHIAIVFSVIVDDINSIRPGDELLDMKWLSSEEFLSEPHELWSELALKIV